MKIKAIKSYRDVVENKFIKVDEVYETSDERAKYIVDKGYAVYEKTAKTKEEVAKAPSKRRK